MPDGGRVIAGTARSIRLDAPGPGTRPLGDRVKQTLFAVLEPVLPGARFLDLFAGSGAGGIEALSRGAAHATFVERDAAAARVIVANLARTHLGSPDRVTVVREDVLGWLREPDRADEPRWDIVLARPAVRGHRGADRDAGQRRPAWSPPAAGSSPSTSGATLRRPGPGC